MGKTTWLSVHPIYMIVHMWNQLPTVTKSSSTLAKFRARLSNINFTGCQCMNCIHCIILSIFTVLRTLGLVYVYTII